MTIESHDKDPDQQALKLLARAPIVVFLLVAAADGKLDKKEIKRFAQILQNEKFAILVAAMNQVEMSAMDVLLDVQQNIGDPLAELKNLGNLLDTQFPAEAAMAYRGALLMLGKGIAEASGGLFGVFGSKVSKEEKAALVVIADALGLIGEAGGNEKQSMATMSANELPDNLFPVLKPAEWAEQGKNEVAMRCLYEHGDMRPNEPVVGYAIDRPESVMFVNADQLDGELGIDQLHAHALSNMEQRLVGSVEWRELSYDAADDSDRHQGLGPISGLVLTGDYYCSEALLSEQLLKQAHEKLDSVLLMAIAPARGELYVTQLVSEAEPEPERALFAHFALARHFNPEQAPISPNVWIVRNGKLVGHVEGMDAIIASARDSAERKQQDEADKLQHSAEAFSEGQGFGLDIAIVAKDLGVMMKNLQHLLRAYVQQAAQQGAFTGIARVAVDIADPDYAPEMKSDIAGAMDDMFEFLNQQFAGIGITGADGAAVKLSYSLDG